jgi:hypothetical protein
MATAQAVITALRYDLREVRAVNYSAEELLEYLNRAVRALYRALTYWKFDWVKDQDTSITLSSGNNSCSQPSDFGSPIALWTGSGDECLLKTTEYIWRRRQFISGTGKPWNYAILDDEFIFEHTADDDYSLTVDYYKIPASDLALGTTMPFSDRFNDELKKAVVLSAKVRQERTVAGDAIFYEFFVNELRAEGLRRMTPQREWRLNY